ncbi:MAG: hypothetical protein EBY20_01985 [Alphaproteobacteria bacterium]|nr:hypothetical protein [Alphaproteobacteria bacterium]
MFICPKDHLFYFSQTHMGKNREKPKNQEKEEKYSISIIPADFFSLNEIEISQRILEIKNYSQHFNPILKNSYVNIGEIDDDGTYKWKEGFEETPDKQENLMIKRLNIENKPTFYQVFYEKTRETSPRKYVLNLINSYKSLLETAKKLESAKLINLDFHPSTLVYKEESPSFTDFSSFFHLPTMNEERKSFLFNKYNPKNVFFPTEAHLICFLIENKQESVSNSNIEEIVRETGERVGSLNSFSKDFIEQYKENTRFSLQSFINKPKQVIIQEILLKSPTWNCYGLSIIFIVLLRDIFGPLSPENKFISQFSQLLTQNIHPLPDKRPTPMQNISLFNDILYNTDKQEFLNLFASLSGLL